MKRVVSDGRELREVMPATIEAVENYCVCLRQWAASIGLWNTFGVELLVREALNNAVLHGCDCDPSKQVKCILRLRRGRITIAVRDEGCGFDWVTSLQQGDDLDACSGRGMFIYKQYADRVRFGSRGNSVVLVKRLDKDCIR